MELVPIKVKIGLKSDGSALYPDFNSLASVVGDWSIYIDSSGSGWIYDCCGHKEEEPGSPVGIQWGMILVPEAMATEAVNTFPNKVSNLTEAECIDFYDNKHAKDFEDEEINEKIVSTLKIKQDLGQTLSTRQLSALDPTTDTPGIRKNWRKTWVDFKAKKAITVAP